MGASTVGALSAFQASVGLAVTGKLNAPTLVKLFGPEDVAPHLEPFPRAAALAQVILRRRPCRFRRSNRSRWSPSRRRVETASAVGRGPCLTLLKGTETASPPATEHR